jgi:hypothetical protein
MPVRFHVQVMVHWPKRIVDIAYEVDRLLLKREMMAVVRLPDMTED